MRDYAKISTRIWNSRKFGAVDDDAKLLYFYLHTCQHANSVGCFVLKDLYACADLEWEMKRYRKGIETLSKANLVAIDTLVPVVRLIGFFRFSPFSNWKHAQGAISIALALPDCQQKAEVLREISLENHVKDEGDLTREIERIDSLSIPYRNPIDTSETETIPRPRPNRDLDQTETEHTSSKKLPAKIDDCKFEEWWKLYPRKVGKAAAQKAFRAKVKQVGTDVLFSELKRQMQLLTQAAIKEPGQNFCPHPATWLNQERFFDEPNAPRRNVAKELDSYYAEMQERAK